MNRFYLTVVFSIVLGTAIGLMISPLTTNGDQRHVALWMEVVHRVCTAIGGLGTFVALIIVLRQFYLLRTQSELVQKNIVASMDAQLYIRLDSFNRFVFEHYQAVHLSQRLRRLRYLHRRSDSFRLEQSKLAGWDLHPLGLCAFPRRTSSKAVKRSRRNSPRRTEPEVVVPERRHVGEAVG